MAHAVFFYKNEAFLIETVAAFICSAYAEPATVIVIVTEPHRKQLHAHFQSLDQAEIEATVLYIDAVDLLSSSMVNGQPDHIRFISSIESILERATLRGPTRIYGEMMALLWTQGNTRAALRLEDLWTELAARYRFTRLCGYPLSGFPNEDHESFHQVCHIHTRVLQAEQAR